METLTYEEFKESCRSGIEEQLGEGVTATIDRVQKNNTVYRDGVIIKKDSEYAGPIYYLEPYYQQYVANHDLNTVIRTLVEDYLHLVDDLAVPDEGFLTNFSNVKRQIAAVLVSKDANRKLLETCPFTDFLDLALIYRAFVTSDSNGLSSCLITNDLLQLWGITEHELKCIADENALSLFHPRIQAMTDIMERSEEVKSLLKLYVITNQYGLYGASCIQYPGVLDGLTEQLGTDLVLIPSSIHEFLLLPCGEVENDFSGVSEIVKEVNQMVCAEDILSDHVYLYDRAKKEISSI